MFILRRWSEVISLSLEPLFLAWKSPPEQGYETKSIYKWRNKQNKNQNQNQINNVECEQNYISIVCSTRPNCFHLLKQPKEAEISLDSYSEMIETWNSKIVSEWKLNQIGISLNWLILRRIKGRSVSKIIYVEFHVLYRLNTPHFIKGALLVHPLCD